jgi:hypothetical protein
MRRAYAKRTRVPVEQSRNEIERTLTRFGATGFIYGWQEDRAVVGFQMADRHVKFILPMPKAGSDRDGAEARRRWRALVLVIKAKLEAVADGIAVFDNEFMAHIVTPDGTTLGEKMLPQIEQMYRSGKMPPLLGYEAKP